MKWLAGICILFFHGMAYAEFASPGALTEGLFIMRNKQVELKERIHALKKELTSCFSQEKSSTPLLTYHCSLKQLIYPVYIDELGALAASNEAAIGRLDEAIGCKQQELDEAVAFSFLIIDKLKLDEKLLSQLIELDQVLAHEKKLPKKKRTGQQEQKKKFLELKKKLTQLSDKIFTGRRVQQIAFESLPLYEDQ